ncbi:MAG: hypothetical protein CMO26_11225 [Thiotrichales bacterium]|nr:hypothetical protein [Thiotrichales bacterium]|tara:strand:- start:103 stop:828 length:726 start_codon:yes stop_codon:yes gene_type:complete
MRTLLAACVLVVWSLCGSAASATGLEADEINAITDDILANSPFASEQTIYRWRYRGDLSLEDDEENEELASDSSWLFSDLSGFLGGVAEFLLWALVAFVIAQLIIKRDRWLGLFKMESMAPEPRLPTALVGLLDADGPLPDDIPASAWSLWVSDQHRAALSLLYRGALLNLVSSAQFDLPDSATEEDCLRVIGRSAGDTLTEYFTTLTRCWQRAAYAAHMPTDQDVRALCDDWRGQFGGER